MKKINYLTFTPLKRLANLLSTSTLQWVKC